MNNSLSQTPLILDCTLRDGGYVIDFKFTDEEIGNIVSELSNSGVPYIEVGHGLGLGAYRQHSRGEILSDEQTLEIAHDAISNSLLGMFFIGGMGEAEDIRLASRRGLDFVRIGTNISNYKNAYQYIDVAKNAGLKVFLNFMKSYTVNKFTLLQCAKDVQERGIDAIYVVDSAGGMLPAEVGGYLSLLHENLDCDLGFHGHNNLMLVNANNLAALENGAKFIDTTLMGMGRGAGNSPTESMVYVLKRMGVEIDIDAKAIADCANKYIASKIKGMRPDDIDVVGGYARFHSGFYDKFLRVANEYNVDVRDLIINVSEKDKEDPSEELIYSEAVHLRDKSTRIFSPRSINVRKDK